MVYPNGVFVKRIFKKTKISFDNKIRMRNFGKNNHKKERITSNGDDLEIGT